MMRFPEETACDAMRAPLAAPGWIVAQAAGDPTAAALAAGAALAALHPLALEHACGVPHALLRDRLALMAAEACAIRAGENARAGDMRDAVHLRLPRERLGPAGEALDMWRRMDLRCVGAEGWPDPEGYAAGEPGACVHHGLALRARGWSAGLAALDPMTAAATALERLLACATRAERAAAVMLADATLARSLGWSHPLPVLGPGLRREDMRLTGAALRLACLRAAATQAPRILTLVGDLCRRAARLRAVAPSLRARAAGAAVRLFLTQDVVAPSLALAPTVRGGGPAMSDRAARRLCERLVALGVVRETTGRATHRLYGL